MPIKLGKLLGTTFLFLGLAMALSVSGCSSSASTPKDSGAAGSDGAAGRDGGDAATTDAGDAAKTKGGDTATDTGTDVAGEASTDGGTDVADGGTVGTASAAEVIGTINANVPGGVAKFQVPATNAAIPLPRAPAGQPNRYDTTEYKAYLGKLLFHDPIRTQRVNENKAQPQDLPANTAFGGTIFVSDETPGAANPGQSANSAVYGSSTQANVNAIRTRTLATGSCGSCHIGEANGKAGQVINFNVGGEGRGFIDANGNFVARRRPIAGLVPFRTTPLFPGDTGVDALPTLSDIWYAGGKKNYTTPAFFYSFLYPNAPTTPTDLALLASGRLDQIDSVGRESPAMLGFAFNNRLLFGGFGGQPHDQPGSLQPSYLQNTVVTNISQQPVDDPAQENLNFLLLDAHRMLTFEAAALQKIPAYVALFALAFPDEYKAAQTAFKNQPAGGTLTGLEYIDNYTESRARSSFLRTDVTRNTPFDQFIGGNTTALTGQQLRGANLFFTKASEGGANCFVCHGGPMFNKQVNDTDLAGVGALIEENFVNVGIGDHPLQALNALARGHNTTTHAEDVGRAEITGNAADNYKFRTLTLRQLNDGFTFFHNGSFTDVRSVVEYFNKGVPQDPTVGASPTIDARFTSPRGAGTTGLGLTEAQVDDLTEFLVKGLYDPSHAKTFQPDPATELSYSKTGTIANTFLTQAFNNVQGVSFTNLGPVNFTNANLIDGLMPSLLAVDDNDDLARRDEGLQFLDVTSSLRATPSTASNVDTWTLTNSGTTPVDTNLLAIVEGLAQGVTVDTTLYTAGVVPAGADGIVTAPYGHPAGSLVAGGLPYYRVYLPSDKTDPAYPINAGQLKPGQSVTFTVTRSGGTPTYTLRILSGQDNPGLGRTP